MRTMLTISALITMFIAVAQAQPGTAPPKATITDEAIINMLGSRLAKMFAACGTPEDVAPKRGETAAEDDVFLDYGPYGFRVRKKIIRTCFFFSDWEKPIRGIKIGATTEEVTKVLGKPTTTIKNKDGAVTSYGFPLKELDAELFANFDENGKVWRVEVAFE